MERKSLIKDKSYTAGHSHRDVLSYYIYLNFVLKKIKKNAYKHW